MARVIKGDSQSHERYRGVPRLKRAPGKKVIEKEVYIAQEQARAILEKAEAQKDKILKRGAQEANQIREEMQTQGAEEAFATAAKEALTAFHRRWERYEEAAEDIRILALEVAKKILGVPSSLPEQMVDQIMDQGMTKLRARRRLRIQISESRHRALYAERPLLLKRLEKKPDFVIESVSDVRAGFARISTEVGGALCSEQAALDQLAQSIGVVEDAVAPKPERRLETDGHALEPLAGAQKTDVSLGVTQETHALDAETDKRKLSQKSHGKTKHTAAQPADGATGKRSPPAPPIGKVDADLRDLDGPMGAADFKDGALEPDRFDADDLDLFADENVRDH